MESGFEVQRREPWTPAHEAGNLAEIFVLDGGGFSHRTVEPVEVDYETPLAAASYDEPWVREETGRARHKNPLLYIGGDLAVRPGQVSRIGAEVGTAERGAVDLGVIDVKEKTAKDDSLDLWSEGRELAPVFLE